MSIVNIENKTILGYLVIDVGIELNCWTPELVTQGSPKLTLLGPLKI